jgi:hypothetical protein
MKLGASYFVMTYKLRQTHFAAAVILFCGIALTAAQPDSLLLPPQLDGWEQTNCREVNPRQLEQVAGEEAALLREYGVQETVQCGYSKGNGSWSVTVHRMTSRSSAYGAFTLLRPITGTARNIGEAGASFPVSGGGRTIFYQGSHFVLADAGASRGALGDLAVYLEGTGGPHSSLPLLPEFLPAENLVPGSETYLLGPLGLRRAAPLAAGDWVGFAYGGETVAARYRSNGGSEDITLLLLNYPTPQITSATLRGLQDIFDLEGTLPDRPRAYVFRAGTLIVFISGTASREQAGTLAQGVQYSRELAWSNPPKGLTDTEWLNSIGNVFIGTGVMMLLAMLVAVTFAALRYLIERLWPGKVFNRPENTEVIHLNLGNEGDEG